MNLAAAQEAFGQLVGKVQPDAIAEFLQWINESFTTVKPPTQDNEAFASMRAIIEELRSKVPVNAVLPSERTLWPEYGVDHDCDANTTVHVDGLLYDDDEVDELVEKGLLSRNYCRACGSQATVPLTFISFSLSHTQLRYIFTQLLPQETLREKRLLDVGSRLGGVLYAAYFYSPLLKQIVGVEMNDELCALQTATVATHALADRVTVVCADVRGRPSDVAAADVVVLNNVFQFFLPPPEQADCWRFLRQAASRKGVVVVSCPSVQTLTAHLQLDFALDDWLQQIPTEMVAAKFSGGDEDKYKECSSICLYQVR